MAQWKIENKPKENSCNLRPVRNKNKDSQPDFRGNMHLSKDVVKFLVACVKEGKEPLLSIQAYDNGIVDRSKEGQYGPNMRLLVNEYDESYMDQSNQSPPPSIQKAEDDFDLDDDIPF